ncbi:MAG: DinB family protein [Pyrinomonadaceae bacterium]|nr:DinB family protein [Pyrinomonadaceae bacterium]
MSAKSSHAELNGLLNEAQAVTVETQREFGQLNAEQLNWKPSAEEWSIGQCFEHLIMTNETFYPDLDELLSGEKRRTFWEQLPLLPGLFGKLIISRVRPDSGKKSKAPKVFAPSQSEIDSRVIEKFVAHQNELAEKLRATEKMDLRRVKVTSPVAKFVTYSLLDAFTILVFHERRHFQQAQRVLAANGFPRS